MAAPRPREVYVFGPFRLDVAERQLTRDRDPVPLRAKVFDTLVELVRRAGRLATREELIQAVWPDAIVEEGNLSHNVSALRKALGDGEDALYIETVPRSGYRFLHPLAEAAETDRSEAAPLSRARRALEQGAWRAAYEAFLDAREQGELEAADREGLAEAARWCGRHDELVPLLEEAAQAWIDEGEPLRAACVSLDLAGVLLDRGRVALAKSYARQAERRLPPEPAESGLALRARSRLRRLRARLCWCDADWAAALEHARAALEHARAAEDPDAEALASIDVSHSLLALERFAEVPASLDEPGAHVASGRLGPYASGATLCGLIVAWQVLGRPDRALEWSMTANRWADASGVSYFPGLCRVHRGELSTLCGDLAHAEADLERGVEELGRASSSLVGYALRALGLVRLRRGALDRAEEAFTRALQFGTDPQPGYALLRAARGETSQARRDLERFLSSDGGGERNLFDRHNRLVALGAYVRLALETGARDAARAAVASMDSIAASTGATSHRALVDAARGELSLADGDTSDALARLGASWRAWHELGAPYEAAAVRAQWAEVLLAEGDATRARLELQGAAASFEQIGAELDAQRVRQRVRNFETDAPSRPERIRVRGSVSRAEELRTLLGPEAWRDLVAWLERKLLRCWADHGGRPLQHGDGRWLVEFESRAKAEACVRLVGDSLREHRAQQGFAPELVVEWIEGNARA